MAGTVEHARKQPARLLLAAYWIILAIGVFLRVYQFPLLPLGLNQDESSTGYEAWSLLTTGQDRWGYQLPIYFLGWGSGQNVLYSYIAIPFIAIFGLTTVAVRLPALIFGLATLPLLYATTRAWYGRTTALIAMGILAVTPWHFMLSRWALESNIAPFFLLLGAYSLTRALKRPNPVGILFSLLPWALALYAYGLTAIPIGCMLAVFIVVYRKTLRTQRKWWLSSLALFIFLSIPFGFFLLKNYLHVHWQWLIHLPFTIPDLTASRADQVSGSGQGFALMANLFRLLLEGSNDGFVWNTPGNTAPFPSIIVWLALLGYLFRLIMRKRKGQRSRQPASIFDVWLLGALSLLLLFPLDLNQGNSLYLPIIVLAAVTIGSILRFAPTALTRGLVGVLAALCILGGVGPAMLAYFGPSYTLPSRVAFTPGFDQALTKARQAARGDTLYISNQMPLAYIQVLWQGHIQPAHFQHSRATVNQPNFDNFVFKQPPPVNKAYWYLLPAQGGAAPCAHPIKQTYVTSYMWSIGYCEAH